MSGQKNGSGPVRIAGLITELYESSISAAHSFLPFLYISHRDFGEKTTCPSARNWWQASLWQWSWKVDMHGIEVAYELINTAHLLLQYLFLSCTFIFFSYSLDFRLVFVLMSSRRYRSVPHDAFQSYKSGYRGDGFDILMGWLLQIMSSRGQKIAHWYVNTIREVYRSFRLSPHDTPAREH